MLSTITATLAAPSVLPPTPTPTAVPAVRPGPSADLQAFRAGLVRFTVNDVTRMAELGLLPQGPAIELLDGLLVRRECGPAHGDAYAEGEDHNFTVAAIAAAAPRIVANGCHLRTQSLLLVTGGYAPYPDAIVLRGSVNRYRGRRPTATDVFCLIEVSDGSCDRDAGGKLLAYAAAGVPQCIIVDLRRRLAEVYAGPIDGTYPPPTVVAPDGSLPLQVGDGHVVLVPLADLLP